MKVKALLGFGATAAASKATAASMVADATVAGRAWDYATRPRVMPVTTVPTGVPGAPGVPVPGGRGWRGRIPTILAAGAGRNVAIGTTIAILSTPGASGAKEGDRRANRAALAEGQLYGTFPFLTSAYNKVVAGEAVKEEVDIVRSVDYSSEEGMRVGERKLAALYRKKPWLRGTAGPPGGGFHPPPGSQTKPGPGTGPGSFTFKTFEKQARQIEERRLDAEATPGEADDVKIAKQELVLVRRALRELELTRDQRIQLKQRRNALLAEISAVEQQADQDAQQARDEADAKRKANASKKQAAEAKRKQAAEDARDRRHQRVLDAIEANEEKLENRKKAALLTDRLTDDKKALQAEIAFQRARERDDRLTAAERRKHKAKRLEAQKELRDLGKKKGGAGAAGDEDKPLTEAELRRMLYDFATGLHGTIAAYGSNVGDSAADYGMLGTQAQLQTMELTRQTQILAEFTGAVRHPMTGYHRTEGTTLLTGYGF
jgi:hypothetical protein